MMVSAIATSARLSPSGFRFVACSIPALIFGRRVIAAIGLARPAMDFRTALVQHGADDGGSGLVQLLRYPASFVSIGASGADGQYNAFRDPGKQERVARLQNRQLVN